MLKIEIKSCYGIKPIFKGQLYKKIPLFLSIMNERNTASI
jgi:hypothetical protein